MFFSFLIFVAAAFSWHVPQAAAQDQAPAAGSFPRSLDFGEIPVGGTSAAQTIFYRNANSGPVFITGIRPAGGNFDLAHDCPLDSEPLPSGSFCTINVRFTPADVGIQSGQVQVDIGTPSGTQVIPIQGAGEPLPRKVARSTASLEFPDTTVNTTSGPLQVVFTNDSANEIFLNGLSVVGDFSVPFTQPLPASVAGAVTGAGSSVPKIAVNAGGSKAVVGSCPNFPINFSVGFFSVPLAPGDSCEVSVFFTPSAPGVRTGLLALNYFDSFENSASIGVNLTGYGVPVDFPDISLSTEIIDFGNVVVGTTASRGLTVLSTGVGPLGIAEVSTTSASGIFSATTDCDGDVAPGSSCSVTVSCKPISFARVEGDLFVVSDARPALRHVKLICSGVALPIPKIEVTVTGIGFGRQSLGSTSVAREILVRSVGTAPLAISGINTTAPFAVNSDCPASLAPGLTCLARVSFTPARPGVQTERLGIGSNDPDRPAVNVDLSGTGCRPFSILAARRGINLCGP